MNTLTSTIPTFPMRPINGGPFHLARPKRGEWVYEPKVNGWRALVNTRTGEMFNRHGKPLTINDEFWPTLDYFKGSSPYEWLDCEGLARRHALDRGKIYVLDYIPESYDKTPWIDRNEALMNGPLADFVLGHYSQDQAMRGWTELQEVNRSLGCEYYEGFVAKRLDSPYVHQMRSDKEETTLWIKHRWEF